MAAMLVSTIILTRILPQEIFGKLIATISFASVTNILIWGWIPSSVVRFSAGSDDGLNKILVPGVWFVIYSFFLLLIVAVPISWVFFFDYRLFVLYGLVYAMAETFNAILVSFYRGTEKSKTVNLTVIIFVTSTTLISALVTKFSSSATPLITYISAYLCGSSFYIILSLIRLKLKPLSIALLNHHASTLKLFFKFGFPLSGNSLCIWFSTMGNRLILGMFCGAAAIAQYTVAFNGASFLIEPLATLIIFSRYPRMIKLYDNKNFDGLKSLIDSSIRFYLLLTGAGLTFFLAYPDLLGRVIGGDSYNNLGPLFLLLLPGILAQCLSSYANKPFELAQKTRDNFILLTSITVINLLLTLLAGKLYNATGIAIARSFTFILYFITAYFWGRKHIKWSFPFPFTSILCTATFGLFISKRFFLDNLLQHQSIIAIIYAVEVTIVFAIIAKMTYKTEEIV